MNKLSWFNLKLQKL